MSFQFKYSKVEKPQLPLLDLLISNDFKRTLPEKGKIDTGSFITVIPKYLIKSLDLKSNTIVKDIRPFGSKKGSDTDAYFVYVTIGNTKFDLMKVISDDRDNVLLGRDIINLWSLELDGQNSSGQITPWSTDPNQVV